MTEKELKKFLKEHLRIELYDHRESYRSYLGVTLKIDEEEIKIYSMFNDDWSSLQVIANSFEQFINILKKNKMTG